MKKLSVSEEEESVVESSGAHWHKVVPSMN